MVILSFYYASCKIFASTKYSVNLAAFLYIVISEFIIAKLSSAEFRFFLSVETVVRLTLPSFVLSENALGLSVVA